MDETINLSRPQKGFGYPEFSSIGPSSEPLKDLQRIILAKSPESVHVEPNFLKSIEALFDELKIKASDQVAIQAPAPKEFLSVIKNRARLVLLPRDPEELFATDFHGIKLFLFSHPSGADGFYYPAELYERIVQKALFQAGSYVYSDERQLLFSFNSVTPGSAKSFLPTGRVFIGGSLYPIMCPQGPETSWWYSGQKKLSNDKPIDVEELLTAQKAVFAFRSRQGGSLQEFQRKLLVLQVCLREMADLLKAPILRGDISVPFWPETGFNLVVDMSSFLIRNNLTVEAFQNYVFTHKGLYIESAEAYGSPSSLILCFAAKPSKLKPLTAGFLESLTEIGGPKPEPFRV